MAEGKETGGRGRKGRNRGGRDPERPGCQTGQALGCLVCLLLAGRCRSSVGLGRTVRLSLSSQRVRTAQGRFSTGHKVAHVLRYRGRAPRYSTSSLVGTRARSVAMISLAAGGAVGPGRNIWSIWSEPDRA